MDKGVEGPNVAENMRQIEGRKVGDRSRRCGLYMSLQDVDGRTSLGKAIKRLRERLMEYVGEEGLTPAVQILLERITFKAVRLSVYEAHSVENSVEVKESDHYLPMANSLREDLRALSEISGRIKSPSLEDLVRRFEL